MYPLATMQFPTGTTQDDMIERNWANMAPRLLYKGCPKISWKVLWHCSSYPSYTRTIAFGNWLDNSAAPIKWHKLVQSEYLTERNDKFDNPETMQLSTGRYCNCRTHGQHSNMEPGLQWYMTDCLGNFLLYQCAARQEYMSSSAKPKFIQQFWMTEPAFHQHRIVRTTLSLTGSSRQDPCTCIMLMYFCSLIQTSKERTGAGADVTLYCRN